MNQLINLPGRIASKLLRIATDDQRTAYANLSYSQEGEDMILARYFEGKSAGFYVDVGAHHPQRFSNTYRFYLSGWRGINIDAMPGSMKLFIQLRPRDINLEIPISDVKEELTYYSFNEPALNGFSKQLADERNGLASFRVISEMKLMTRTLAEVLTEHLPPSQTIDFLSVDVEGLDYQVLASNDWQKVRPEIVLAEDLEDASIDELQASKVSRLMNDNGYQLQCKTVNTLFFKRK